MTTYLACPIRGSQSAKFLRANIDAVGGVKRFRPELRQRADDRILNWGSSKLPRDWVIYNRPGAVEIAVDKLLTAEVFKRRDIPTPYIPRDRTEAQRILDRGEVVLGRDLVRGSQGRGITVYKPRMLVGEHKYYSVFKPRTREFRIHVVGNTVIFQQEKLRRMGFKKRDDYVLNVGEKYVFAFKHLEEKPVPENARICAIQAVQILGLDYGAVDLGYNDPTGEVCVYEVNTAPGIEGTCANAWAVALTTLVNGG